MYMYMYMHMSLLFVLVCARVSFARPIVQGTVTHTNHQKRNTRRIHDMDVGPPSGLRPSTVPHTGSGKPLSQLNNKAANEA